jgi:hypothetical protein
MRALPCPDLTFGLFVATPVLSWTRHLADESSVAMRQQARDQMARCVNHHVGG